MYVNFNQTGTNVVNISGFCIYVSDDEYVTISVINSLPAACLPAGRAGRRHLLKNKTRKTLILRDLRFKEVLPPGITGPTVKGRNSTMIS
jgi:hypothetical protein